MSLKAKIEAVIYASEEPVTLPQLMGLLGEEAQAELDALDARQASLPLDPDAIPDAAAVIELHEPGHSAQVIELVLAPLRNRAAVPAVEDEDLGEPNDPEALNAETLSDTEEEQQEPAAEGGQPTDSTEPASEAAEAADTAELEPGTETDLENQAPEADRKLAKLRERRLRDFFRSILDELIADYANGDRGLEVREVAGGFRLATKPEYHDAVRGFVRSLKPPLKLSLQALETLAVVAYKQPVTAPEVSEIRGVDSGGVLNSLMTRKLVTTAGRKQVIGRPILYKTTREFLLRFGLKDINELPSIEEFERMAGELNEAVQEEIPMESATPQPVSETTSPSAEPTSGNPASVEPMRDIHQAQADGDPGEDVEASASEPLNPAPHNDTPAIERELDGKEGGA